MCPDHDYADECSCFDGCKACALEWAAFALSVAQADAEDAQERALEAVRAGVDEGGGTDEFPW